MGDGNPDGGHSCHRHAGLFIFITVMPTITTTTIYISVVVIIIIIIFVTSVVISEKVAQTLLDLYRDSALEEQLHIPNKRANTSRYWGQSSHFIDSSATGPAPCGNRHGIQ